MNEFYTILINSLKKRDLWDRSEREKLYEQARVAMIQKLWAMGPGLESAQVQERIRQFEAAVKQVEADVTVAERFRQFGPGDSPAAIAYVPSEPAPEDDRWSEGTTEGPLLEGTVLQPEPEIEFDFKLQFDRLRQEEPEFDDAAETLPAELPALPAPQQRRPFRRHQPRQLGENDDTYDSLAEEEQRSWEEDAPDWRTGVADDEDELAGEAQPQAASAAPAAKGRRRLTALSMDRLFQLGARGDRWEPPKPLERGNDLNRLRGYLDRSIRKLSGGRMEGGYGEPAPSQAEPKGRASRYVTVGIAGVVACVMLWGIFTVVPVLLRGGDVVTERSGEDGRAIAAEAPPTPVTVSTTAPPTTGATPPTPIVVTTTPMRLASLPVQERIPLFDGRNPTAFTSGPDNPIRFAADGNKGGFARISSSASSAGAKLVVGPGVSQRLAGKVIRIVVEVRASAEQGANTMRVGYQTGAQVSPWRAGPVGKGFSTLELTWQVPTSGGKTANVVLIEPGVPGSGTAVDIKSITLEVLKSG